MLKAIIFDLDQTLLDRTTTFELFLQKQYARFSDEFGTLSASAYIDLIQHYDNNGYAPKEEVYARFCNDHGLDLSGLLFADFLEFYGQEPILFQNAKAVLETLSKNYPLGLITNGRSAGQNTKIDNAGIRKFFKVIKVSETEGVKKPNPIIFKRCLSELTVAPQNAVYVGDHPNKDVGAAQNVGMKGIWVINQHFSAPEYADGTISKLNELFDLLPSMRFN